VNILREADIVLTRSNTWLGRSIRFMSTHLGDSKSQVNHCGIMVTPTLIVEALNTVKRRPLIDAYGVPSKQLLAVYRPRNLTGEESVRVVMKANSYVGRTYGYLKIVAHALDWVLQGAYVFRRMAGVDKYPICSWVVAHAYGVVGKYFGVAPGAATPADIWDFVTRNPDKYEQVWPLSRWQD
jgi:hypothetical protein